MIGSEEGVYLEIREMMGDYLKGLVCIEDLIDGINVKLEEEKIGAK